ncbi:MAG TPA: DNA repair protein RecO [Ilumatobacteraceae bacterium]|nr:DNA repair protein RecO [Ilumatobacteraceae bacterium]
MRLPLYRDRGVVLRTYKLGEADRIVVILTEEHGKVRAVARGVRKTGSKFGARLEPGSHIAVLMAEGRDLDIVSQAEVIDSMARISGDLNRMTAALAILEVTDQMTLEREPTELYRMVAGALRTVAEVGGPMVVPAYFWKVLAAEGVRPELDRCVRCDDTGPLVAIDFDQGGTLCRACRSGSSISEPALDMMRRILGGQMTSVLHEPPSPVTHEVSTLAARAVEHHIERRLRSVALFEGL